MRERIQVLVTPKKAKYLRGVARKAKLSLSYVASLYLDEGIERYPQAVLNATTKYQPRGK